MKGICAVDTGYDITLYLHVMVVIAGHIVIFELYVRA